VIRAAAPLKNDARESKYQTMMNERTEVAFAVVPLCKKHASREGFERLGNLLKNEVK
jgi:hypothetical protein